MTDAPRESVESWKNNPWSKLPIWAKWTIGIVSVLVLLGIGAAIGSSGESKIKDERDEARTQVAQANQERNRAEAEAEAVQARKAVILSKAKSDAAQIIGDARSEGSELSGKLENLRSEVDSAKGELDETESSLAGAEEEEALSEIGDGIWQAETDYLPGTYRAPGGENCYWATLNSADPYDIASNENGSGPQIATIESPYFQSEGCGTWERIE